MRLLKRFYWAIRMHAASVRLDDLDKLIEDAVEDASVTALEYNILRLKREDARSDLARARAEYNAHRPKGAVRKTWREA
jgi:hypothetical protein